LTDEPTLITSWPDSFVYNSLWTKANYVVLWWWIESHLHSRTEKYQKL